MPLNLRDIAKAANNNDTVMTPLIQDWLLQHGDEEYDRHIADWIRDQLVTKPRNRSASFSASSAGGCPRAQQLQYLGIRGLDSVDVRLQNIFNDGKWRHLRWQAMSFMAEALTKAEMPLFWRNMRSRGTIDGYGIVPDDHPRALWRGMDYGFELKGMNPFGYQKAIKGDPEMKHEHKLQVHRYFLMGGFDLFVIIYENKGCVPEYTRCMTRRGWTYHYDLVDGDEILTYNMEQDCMEWEPYQNKVVYEADSAPLYRVGNKHQEFVTTRDHRWAVRDQQGNMSVRRTDQLNSNSWVPFHAPYEQKSSVCTPYEAEAIGWVASDGWISDHKWYTIAQSKPEGTKALDALLEPTDLNVQGPYDGMYYYYLKGPLRSRLRELLPTKDHLPSLVTRMDRPALEAFVRGCLGGDGSWAPTGMELQFCQNDGLVKEAFQIACTLLGIRYNINEGKLSGYLGNRRWMRTYTSVALPQYERVWCPKTTNGFWLMEQNGKAVITGNTQEWHEWVIEPDDEYLEMSQAELELLNDGIDNQRLAPVLNQCKVHTGQFKECTFGMQPGNSPCLRAGRWPNIQTSKSKKGSK